MDLRASNWHPSQLRTISLASATGDCGGPVEALAERIAHEGAWRHVVAAYARVDVSKELAPLRDRYASLQDA
jgi:hypothetical protein